MGTAHGPAPELLDRAFALIAPGREFIDLHRCRRRQLAPREHARGLEPLEPLREDVRADSWQAALEFAEAPPAEHQLANDQQRPALAHQLERKRGAASI